MKHLAVIADGNRRWARENDLPVKAGYLQGLVAIERCCEWAIKVNVPYLTVYCFSTENWNRPQSQVDTLMNLARWYFTERKEWYIYMGVSIHFLGRRDRLPEDIVSDMTIMEKATQNGQNLVLTICIDYGGRDEIVRAIAAGARTEAEIDAILLETIPAPDMILRTGGNLRLSNFLLWQAAYTELAFTKTLFPALVGGELDSTLEDYHSRKKNFGR